MRIAAWNVNSINARMPTVTTWLAKHSPDVVCMQELKCLDEKFPRLELEALGYNCAVHGQKTYNGVAILSKFPLSDVAARLPGDEADEQARYLEATVEHPNGVVRIASLYAPNGNPVGTEKFPYKLAWLERLNKRAIALRDLEEPVVLAGDYNIAPRDEDVHDPAGWAGDALCQPQSRAAYRALTWAGYTDAFAATDGRAGQYTFWDYQGGAWPKDHGVRIDHLMCSPQATDRLIGVEIARDARAMEKPSDHAPIIVSFEF